MLNTTWLVQKWLFEHKWTVHANWTKFKPTFVQAFSKFLAGKLCFLTQTFVYGQISYHLVSFICSVQILQLPNHKLTFGTIKVKLLEHWLKCTFSSFEVVHLETSKTEKIFKKNLKCKYQVTFRQRFSSSKFKPFRKVETNVGEE